MCNLCVCMSVCVTLQRTNADVLDPFAATSSINANRIESNRMTTTTKANRCKFTRVNGSNRNRKVNVTYCWRYIYVCMFLCVCNTNNYELLRLYGCVVIGQTVCLAGPSVRVCVCACASGCCCAIECVCQCDSKSALIKARPARNSSLLSLANIIRQQRHQLCVQSVCVCERVTGANPGSTIIICINKRTFSFFCFLCVPLSRLSYVAVVDDCCCCCYFCCCCCYCDVFVTNCFQVVFYFINCRRNHVWNVLTIQLRHTKHNFFDIFNKNQCIIHFLASYFLFSFLCCFFFY